jgi:hypothetical protein
MRCLSDSCYHVRDQLFGIAAMAAILVAPVVAQGSVLIPSSANLGSTAMPGSGLAGSFWDVSDGDTLDTLALAQSVTPGPASATFLATSIDYPNGAADSTSTDTKVSDFLGADSSTLSPASAGDVIVLKSVFEFSGLIDIQASDDTNPGTSDIEVVFAVGSDDGFRLTLGGVLVSEFDGLRGFGFSSETAIFQSAGLYAINLLYFEGLATEAGLVLASSIGGSPMALSVIPSSRLYPVDSLAIPEPSSAAMAGLGVLILSFRSWNRHRQPV